MNIHDSLRHQHASAASRRQEQGVQEGVGNQPASVVAASFVLSDTNASQVRESSQDNNLRANANALDGARNQDRLMRSGTLEQLAHEVERLPLTTRHEGFVLKRGHVHKAFQKRYFVLNEGTISYYRDKSYYCTSRPPQGSLPCQGISVLESGQHDHGFEFTFFAADGKEIVCAVPTESERLDWIEKVTKAASEPQLEDSGRRRLSQKIRSHNPHLTQIVESPTLLKRIFGIGPSDGTMPSSRLIFPLSPFAVCWTAATCMFLAYTALVTPAVIAFHWLDEECDRVPTLEFDAVLDSFFLLDVCYNFCVGLIINSEYKDDPAFIASSYIRGSLCFDIVTSIPVSFLELHVAHQCAQSGSGGGVSGLDPTQLRFIRFMKPLRWFKLARIIKLNKAGTVLEFLFDYFSIAPGYTRMLSLSVSIFGSLHLSACAAWLTKVISSPREQVDDFLEGFRTPDLEIDIATVHGKLTTYTISMYFVTTVFSTVGFGDIGPANSSERICCMFLMLTGIVVFGNLLAELADINRATQQATVQKLERVQTAVDFLTEHSVPPNLRTKVLRWTRFFHAEGSDNTRAKNFMDQLPSGLQADLVSHIFGKVVRHVPLFDHLNEADPSFLMELWRRMRYETYQPGSKIVEFGQPADKLILVISGEIQLKIYSEALDTDLDDMRIKAGDFIGDFSLLGDMEWGSSTMIGMPEVLIEAEVAGMVFVVCVVIDQESFEGAASDEEGHNASTPFARVLSPLTHPTDRQECSLWHAD